ncbi:probable potassium transporter 17 isoform X1 [Dendrobium catenatum]|uniref:Potassium transporter n=2 Tax=Dendrobium catenatum TaxID=906689 RepID=A0A2I0WAB2_9ASPA|nr:probable potassium transporter 17 isoform X1 [Dendrobium catenatum]PKU72596.1 putative potassium transporter 17 [Dendrobium catenatum]
MLTSTSEPSNVLPAALDLEVGIPRLGLLSNGITPAGRRSTGCGEVWRWRDFILAYKTLGVVFGGLVTSPLYVYPSMNLNSPTEEDYLGIYSIMFWTLTLIGVFKYVFIALNADDNGEGGTFALYSLLCRHINIGNLPSRNVNSSTGVLYSNRSMTSETRSKLGKFLEESITAQRILLFIAMLGMCMLIGDGILTPAISVLSAIDGLRGPFPSVSKSAVEAISAVVLLALFLLQKHGTARVSFLFSPIMGTWTLTTPIIGVYSFLRFYPSIFKAVSPHYIVHFFLRNRRKGWELLGGTVLCITGAEAMFADLGHFNKRSIQMACLLTIYPSLVLTYAGQTAYLIKHPDDHNDGFYKFVPHPVYWPMFVIATLAAIVASQSLISATFSVIKQSVTLDYFPRVKVVHTSKHKEGEVYSPETNYILMVLCILVILGFGDGKDIGNAFGVVVILVMFITTLLLTLVMIIIWRAPVALAMLYFVPFFIIEGVYVSAVLTKIPKGGWFPFLVSVVLAFIMFVWYHGRQRKLEYEMRNKISVDSFNRLLSSLEIQRAPGLCFFYSNIQDGLTPLLGHYVRNMRSLHKVTILTTFRYLLVSKVDPNERIIIRKLGIEGLYGCVIQYGYADSLNVEGDNYISQVTNSMREHIRYNFDGLSPTSLEGEISQLEKAEEEAVVHVRGKTRFHIGVQTSFSDKILLGFYEFLHGNCRSALPALGVPLQQRMIIGMVYNT